MKNLNLIATCVVLLIFYSSKSQTINTIAGLFNGDGKSALEIGISPGNHVMDAAGNIYFVENEKNRVRKLSSNGIYSTIAGNGRRGFSGDNGPAINASLNYPTDITFDTAGNLYIVDANNERIRKVATNGIITTFAGNGTHGFSGDGGPATSAQFYIATSIAADNSGNIYIADRSNNRIRKVAPNGIITTVAGNGGTTYGGNGGQAILAPVAQPIGVAVNNVGELFISQGSFSVVRKVSVGGTISLVAGTGSGGYNGNNGLATESQLNYPGKVAFDVSGNVYIPDKYNHRLRKVNKDYGTLTNIAGNGGLASDYDYVGEDVKATSVPTQEPVGVSVDQNGNVFLSTYNLIRKISQSFGQGFIKTVAGNNTFGLSGNGGSIDSAQVSSPGFLHLDQAGNIYFGDNLHHLVRKISTTGIVTAFAGKAPGGYGGDGSAATLALLENPVAAASDTAGNVFICDKNYRIRKVSKLGIITTVAGNGTDGFYGDGGPATAAQLDLPGGVAVDKSGNLFISDSYNQRIRKIDINGIISTFAGNGNRGFSGDGLQAIDAQLDHPNKIKIDKAGNMYFVVLDRVRKINTDGIISTVAGNGTLDYNYKGDSVPALSVGISPSDIAIDESGNVFIADYFFDRILKVTPEGVMFLFAGGGTDYSEGAPVLSAEVDYPSSLAFDQAGDLLYTVPFNSQIRKIKINETNTWTGFTDNNWENPLNWSLNKLPGERTNVVINSGTIIINSNVIIRSLKLSPGVHFSINPDHTLTLLN